MYFQTRCTSVKSFFLYSQIYGVDIGLLLRDVFWTISNDLPGNSRGGELAKIAKHGFPEATGAGVTGECVPRPPWSQSILSLRGRGPNHFRLENNIDISIFSDSLEEGNENFVLPHYHCISVPTHSLQKKQPGHSSWVVSWLVCLGKHHVRTSHPPIQNGGDRDTTYRIWRGLTSFVSMRSCDCRCASSSPGSSRK